MKPKSVDVAVIGEGEYTMLEVAQAFEGKRRFSDVLGIAYRARRRSHGEFPQTTSLTTWMSCLIQHTTW